MRRDRSIRFIQKEENRMKKVISLALAASMALSLAACGGSASSSTAASDSSAATTEGAAAETTTIKVAAIETAYGTEMWQKVADAFTEQTGIAWN